MEPEVHQEISGRHHGYDRAGVVVVLSLLAAALPSFATLV